jgi:CheY-like chemotaxis protein
MLTGPQVLRSIRATPQTAQIPIIVRISPPQNNERQLRKDGTSARLDNSKLGLHQHSESLIQLVKRILNERAEEDNEAELPSLDLSTLQGET